MYYTAPPLIMIIIMYIPDPGSWTNPNREVTTPTLHMKIYAAINYPVLISLCAKLVHNFWRYYIYWSW